MKQDSRSAIRNLMGRGAPPRLALRELEAGASAGLAGLLTLFGTGIALDVTGLLQRRTKLGVHLLESASDAVTRASNLMWRMAEASDMESEHDNWFVVILNTDSVSRPYVQAVHTTKKARDH